MNKTEKREFLIVFTVMCLILISFAFIGTKIVEDSNLRVSCQKSCLIKGYPKYTFFNKTRECYCKTLNKSIFNEDIK